jgi:DNA polymerase III delta subunit
MVSIPTIYLFHGEDRPAIAQALASLQARLGEPSTVEMNSTRFEAPFSLDDLRAAALASPFLADRRLVVVEEASRAYPRADSRTAFIALLEEVPTTTALVLVERSSLARNHWLHKWAASTGDRAFIREFALPKGGAMVAWIQEKAQEKGGEIQPQAASSLAALLGSDTLAAEHELEKLLAYANYARLITAEDVALLALEIGEQGDFFGLIDALSTGASTQAMSALHKLLAERDPISLFFGLVGHFRALIQIREILEQGGGPPEMKQAIGTNSDFRVNKLAGQARRFSLASLEIIYDRLLDLDHQIKTGEASPELAMELLTAALGAQPV